jgi:hypothetical protein
MKLTSQICQWDFAKAKRVIENNRFRAINDQAKAGYFLNHKYERHYGNTI